MANLDPKVVDTLLDRLSSDDEFRALFEKDAAAALAELGVDSWPRVGELKVSRLADKAVIAESREYLRKVMVENLYNIPHKLEA
jgi:putative modified peptide